MAYSMSTPVGAGHQVTPPFNIDQVPSIAPAPTVESVGAEYGTLCVDAVNDALAARADVLNRVVNIPSAHSG